MALGDDPLAGDGRDHRQRQPLGERDDRLRVADGAAADEQRRRLRLAQQPQRDRDLVGARCGQRRARGLRARGRRAHERRARGLHVPEQRGGVVGIERAGEHVGRDLDCDRPRAAAAQLTDHVAQRLRRAERGGAATGRIGDLPEDRELLGQLVQQPVAGAERRRRGDAREHDHRDRVRARLADPGRGVGDAGAGDHAAGGRAARGAGVAVGHEGGAALVAGEHRPRPRLGEAAVVLQRVDPWDPEDDVDALAREDLGDCTTAAHCSPLSSMWGARASGTGWRRVRYHTDWSGCTRPGLRWANGEGALRTGLCREVSCGSVEGRW